MSETVSIKVEGLKKLEKRFTDITPDVAKAVRKQINAGANKIRKDIDDSFKNGSHGRTFKKTKDGKTHTASLPGMAPNIDTANLRKNVVVTTGTGLITKGYFALVRSRAKYSRALEDGTKNMAARPFMEPAYKKNIKQITGTMVKEAQDITQKWQHERREEEFI